MDVTPKHLRFNEDKYLKEAADYIYASYQKHYGNEVQPIDCIMAGGHGTGFCIGSIQKYSGRYGKKAGEARKDLLKIIHYAILQLHNHDEFETQKESK